MEWLMAIRSAIDDMEAHLQENISLQSVAEKVHISPCLFGKGFHVMTGYSVSEYIRNRRLYLAAVSLRDTDKTVLEVALDVGYDTPESFAKAFSRFHGCSPSAVKCGAAFRTFQPLKIQIKIHGGNQMDCKITKMVGMKLIGFSKVFSAEDAYAKIPQFWNEIFEKYGDHVGAPLANVYEKAIMDNCIGEYAVCIDDMGSEQFRYMIAGRYTGGEVPEGMEVYAFPEGDWAVFPCIGPLPHALQSVNTQIFEQWLPGNAEYELSGNATMEWYDCTAQQDDPDYHSEIWIPVKRK